MVSLRVGLDGRSPQRRGSRLTLGTHSHFRFCLPSARASAAEIRARE